MSKFINQCFIATIVLLLPLPLCTPLCAESSPLTTKRLFLVASYDNDNVCGSPQEQGALEALRADGWIEGDNLQLRRFYMKTKKHYITPLEIRQRGQLALKQITSFHPDIVLTLDDNAFREVGLSLTEGQTQVVFSGMNGQPEDYNQRKHFMQSRQHPGGNITGVYEKLYVAQSLEVLAAAFPQMVGHKVVGITDDSPTGRALSKQFRIELGPRGESGGLYWQERRVHTMAEYRTLIGQLNADPDVAAIYPVAVRLPTKGGKIDTAKNIFPWTIESSTKPELALNYYFSKIGLFGGAAVDFHRMGAVAGHQASLILKGRSAGELSIVDAPDYALVFNLTRAKKLHLDIPMPLLTAADHIFH